MGECGSVESLSGTPEAPITLDMNYTGSKTKIKKEKKMNDGMSE